ncbi:stage II sporulation protein E [Desulfofalx alkaliphila]|uniref:stage II sporulation protein E n=1 Tax=Desulfofalx alkaliphila TaxID=105483 RepID=UPI0004E2112C|nr:stage II sporulation protein E [Desulfofalx alkaliphila]
MFNDFDIYTYRRIGESNKEAGAYAGVGRNKKKKANKYSSVPWSAIRQAFAGRWLLLYLTAFFLGRAVLMGELMPFAVAFVAAAAHVAGARNFGVLVFATLGLSTVSGGVNLISTALAMLALYLIIRFVPEVRQGGWYVVPGAVFITVLIIKCIFVAYGAGALYGYISALFEAVFACVLTIAFMQGLPPLWQRTAPKRISGEAVFCLLLLLGSIVAGTGELSIYNVSLREIVSKFIVLLAALVGGVGLGAAAGAVVGVIPGLSYVVAPVIIGAYSFAGLFAGLFRKFGRIGVAMGFLLGNILLSIYISNYGNMIEVMVETALATLIFCFLPNGWIETINKVLPATPGIRLHKPTLAQTRLKEMTAGKMRDWARVFNELAVSFRQVSATVEQSQEESGLERLFVEVGEKVCNGCALYRTCWEREFYRTYQQILDLLTAVELQGKLTVDDLPDSMKKRCARLKEMVITVTCLYDNFKLNNYWQKKLLDSRQLVSEQLKGISEIMTDLSAELEKDVEVSGEIEEAIRKRLKKEGIPIGEVFIFNHRDGRIEVELSRPPCGGGMECHHKVAPLVSAVTGQQLSLPHTGCCLKEGHRECSFKMYSSLPYRLTVACAKMAKGGQGISGDGYATMQLREGKYALIVSDGMGTGRRAYIESSATIKLLSQLLESGFEKDMAVKTVNSILVLRSPNDSFATVDLALVDLYSGKADLIKICAAPTFLVRKGRVSTISSNSLPVGILEDIEVTTQRIKLEVGDLLVMVTDGVLDGCPHAMEKEEWFKKILEELAALPPQDLAEVLVQIVETGVGGAHRVADDMTVLVAKFENVQI